MKNYICDCCGKYYPPTVLTHVKLNDRCYNLCPICYDDIAFCLGEFWNSILTGEYAEFGGQEPFVNPEGGDPLNEI